MIKKHIKLADDATFEQNFFQLAFAYVRDKIPNLIDYMLGFEVVNKNDEGTQAIGLFKFDVSGRELFVPVFYKNGELKGADLLYSANQNRFIPNRENWVDSILNSSPTELGQVSDAPKADMLDAANPDLTELYNPTTGTKLSHVMSHIDASWSWPLTDFLKQADCRFSAMYARTLMRNPELHKAAAEFYGKDLYDSLTGCKRSVDVLSTDEVPDVEVIDSLAPEPVLESLSDGEKKTLIEEGVVLRDNRTEAKIPYKIEGPTILNANPGKGVVKVLLKGGDFLKAAIIPNLTKDSKSEATYAVDPWMSADRDSPPSHKGHILIPLEGDKNPVQVSSTKVFATTSVSGEEDYRDYIDGLSEASGAKGSASKEYKDNAPWTVFIEADGSQAAGPFNLETPVTSKGDKSFNVFSASVEKVVISSVYRRMKVVDKTLYVPETAKIVSYTAPRYGSIDIDLGTEADIDAKIKGLFDAVKVSKAGYGFNIRVNDTLISKEAAYRDAYITLAVKVGMSLPWARKALKTAGELKPCTFRFEKKAQPFFAPPPQAPAFPSPPMGMNGQLGVMEQYPQQDLLATGGAGPEIQNQMVMNGISGMNQTQPALNQQAVDAIMQAAQTGERDVFDVANISELINKADIDIPLEEYSSDLNTALDRLGRIYFLMLFHNDKFAERYSQEDVLSLEESVRDIFLKLGELLLKLKERKIEADSGSAVETDLNLLL